jgi:hypothetical protein
VLGTKQTSRKRLTGGITSGIDERACPVANVTLSQHFLERLYLRHSGFPKELFFELLPALVRALKHYSPKNVKVQIRNSFVVGRADRGNVMLITVMPVKSGQYQHALLHAADTEFTHIADWVSDALLEQVEPKLLAQQRAVAQSDAGRISKMGKGVASIACQPRVSRNARCPCGKKKKYKKCCGKTSLRGLRGR